MNPEWRTNGADMAQILAAEGRGAPLRHSHPLKGDGEWRQEWRNNTAPGAEWRGEWRTNGASGKG
jgi:hypothetical protein